MAVSVGHYTKPSKQRRHTTETNILSWIQGKTRKDSLKNENFRSDAMVKPNTTYITQKSHSWNVMIRDDNKPPGAY